MMDSLCLCQSFAQRSCERVSEQLKQWGLSGNLTAEDVGCYKDIEFRTSDQRIARPWVQRRRLYACLQLTKKMHPAFDTYVCDIMYTSRSPVIIIYFFRSVLKGILNEDTDAVILVMSKSQVRVVNRSNFK